MARVTRNSNKNLKKLSYFFFTSFCRFYDETIPLRKRIRAFRRTVRLNYEKKKTRGRISRRPLAGRQADGKLGKNVFSE